MIAPSWSDIFPLAIFPDGLTHSLLTSVLVGVIFMAFATETFGGGFSGLVVPGYIAPIFLLQPMAGLLITLQAIATYLTVRALSDIGCRLGFWSVFFGRDRFLALVIVGTLLRSVTEGYLLPMAFMHLGDTLPAIADLRGNLHSIGLICVPLLANMFWKTGVLDGIPPVLLPVGATYLTLRFVLMPLTNFSVSRVELAYDSFAIDLLANPKSYILLMTGMVLASKAALRYGWDFNGIMVPALFSLTWFQPAKLLATCVEAFLIYKLTRRILRLGIFENITIEGPRKTLAAFLIGYATKFVAAHASASALPGLNPLDLFGFGYMLPTLLAVKMIQRENAALVLGPTLLVSAISAITGNVAGLLLTAAIPTASWLPLPAKPGAAPAAAPARENAPRDLAMRLAFDRRLIVPRETINAFRRPWPHEENALSGALVHVRRALEGHASWQEALSAAGSALGIAGLTLSDLGAGETDKERFLYVAEKNAPPARPHGAGIYVFRRRGERKLVIEVPHPLAEPGAVESGAALFERLGASALLVAGAHPLTNLDGSADVLENSRTLFQAAHRVFRNYDALSVRCAFGRAETVLNVVSEVPAQLPLDRLRELLGGFELSWRVLPGRHAQAETAARGFAHLTLGDEAIRRLNRLRFGDAPLPQARDTLPELLGPATAPSIGAAEPTTPSTAELQFLDSALLTPLSALAAGTRMLDPVHQRQLLAAAAEVGYELAGWREPLAPATGVLLLREKPPRSRRWGTYLIRPGAKDRVVIEVPQPRRELRTAEVGATLFQTLEGRALLLDESAGPSSGRAAASLFHLFHQVLAREQASAGEGLFLQVRGFPAAAHPDVDAGMVYTPKWSPGPASDVTSSILGTLRGLGHRVALQDQGPRLAPFAGLVTPQEAYNIEFGAGAFAYLHVSDAARRGYRVEQVSAEEERWDMSFLDRLGIVRRRGSLEARSAEPLLAGTVPVSVREQTTVAMERFIRSRNPNVLAQTISLLKSSGSRLEHFRDLASSLEIFILELPGGRVLLNSEPRDFSARRRAGSAGRAEALRRFVLGRDYLLELTETH